MFKVINFYANNYEATYITNTLCELPSQVIHNTLTGVETHTAIVKCSPRTYVSKAKL